MEQVNLSNRHNEFLSNNPQRNGITSTRGTRFKTMDINTFIDALYDNRKKNSLKFDEFANLVGIINRDVDKRERDFRSIFPVGIGKDSDPAIGKQFTGRGSPKELVRFIIRKNLPVLTDALTKIKDSISDDDFSRLESLDQQLYRSGLLRNFVTSNITGSNQDRVDELSGNLHWFMYWYLGATLHKPADIVAAYHSRFPGEAKTRRFGGDRFYDRRDEFEDEIRDELRIKLEDEVRDDLREEIGYKRKPKNRNKRW